jgi:hypothetical protein
LSDVERIRDSAASCMESANKLPPLETEREVATFSSVFNTILFFLSSLIYIKPNLQIIPAHQSNEDTISKARHKSCSILNAAIIDIAKTNKYPVIERNVPI